MRTFACVLLLVAVAVAAPEGKRDKRGYLSSGWESSHGGWDLGGHGWDSGISHGWDSGISHGWEPKAKIIHVNKVVEVPKVIEVKKVVSVPHVVKVPKVVTVAKVVHEQPHHFESHGWW